MLGVEPKCPKTQKHSSSRAWLIYVQQRGLGRLAPIFASTTRFYRARQLFVCLSLQAVIPSWFSPNDYQSHLIVRRSTQAASGIESKFAELSFAITIARLKRSDALARRMHLVSRSKPIHPHIISQIIPTKYHPHIRSSTTTPERTRRQSESTYSRRDNECPRPIHWVFAMLQISS